MADTGLSSATSPTRSILCLIRAILQINSGYLDLSNLQSLIPVGSHSDAGNHSANLVPPFRVYPTTYRGGTSSLGLTQYDPDIRNPYIAESDDGFDAQRRIQRHGGRPVYRDL